MLGSSSLPAPHWGCELRGLPGFCREERGELGERLEEGRGLVSGDALDINVSSGSGQVNASPVIGLMASRA